MIKPKGKLASEIAREKRGPIKIRKVPARGHPRHGGAWKVAYADFVTALLAFFLLMWLYSSTTTRQREIIAETFNTPHIDMLHGGQSAIQAPGGASRTMIKLGGLHDAPEGPNPAQVSTPRGAASSAKGQARVMQTLMARLKQSIDNSQALKPFKDQLLLSLSRRGLRIQIVDSQAKPMFAIGSATPMPYARGILEHVGKVLDGVPNKISITGHTDARPYVPGRMSNWDLSSERANAARRVMIGGGMSPDQVAEVMGLAATKPLDARDPRAPVNRRISIVVLTAAALAKLKAKQAYQ